MGRLSRLGRGGAGEATLCCCNGRGACQRPAPCMIASPRSHVRQVVLRRLMLELVRKLDDELRHSTAQDAAFYEHRLQVCPSHSLVVGARRRGG